MFTLEERENIVEHSSTVAQCALCAAMGERETAKFLPFSRPRLPPPAVQCELAQHEKEKKTVEKKAIQP